MSSHSLGRRGGSTHREEWVPIPPEGPLGGDGPELLQFHVVVEVEADLEAEHCPASQPGTVWVRILAYECEGEGDIRVAF